MKSFKSPIVVGPVDINVRPHHQTAFIKQRMMAPFTTAIIILSLLNIASAAELEALDHVKGRRVIFPQ